MCIVLCPNSSLHCLPVYLSFALSTGGPSSRCAELLFKKKKSLCERSAREMSYRDKAGYRRHAPSSTVT